MSRLNIIANYTIFMPLITVILHLLFLVIVFPGLFGEIISVQISVLALMLFSKVLSSYVQFGIPSLLTGVVMSFIYSKSKKIRVFIAFCVGLICCTGMLVMFFNVDLLKQFSFLKELWFLNGFLGGLSALFVALFSSNLAKKPID